MNATDAINKIKEMLGLEFSSVEKPTTEVVEEAFATTELEDGTRITNDKEGEFEIGDKVYVVAEDATLTPAPSGEHMLRDGYVIVLDEESTLIEIRVPQSEDVADVVDEAAKSDEETEGKSEFNFENELKNIKSSIEEMLKLMEAQSADFSAQIENVKNEVETFKSAPQHKGITEKKNITENFSDYRYNILNKHRK